MRHQKIMSMIGGLVLAAGALLTAHPATADAPADSPPAEFGNDWHDPLTAAPPVTMPPTRSCEVLLAAAQFRDFTPYKGVTHLRRSVAPAGARSSCVSKER